MACIDYFTKVVVYYDVIGDETFMPRTLAAVKQQHDDEDDGTFIVYLVELWQPDQ